MANYSQLKAAIADVIKTNGTKAITGQVLQDTLNSIVSVIGANYTFAGIATPSTNPSTPDQNVFYIATQGGTYTNFGATALPEGISLLMWNGSWTANTIMYNDGGVFDISVYKSTGGTLAKFADLGAALGTNGANIPAAARKGGMSVKFVQSSDNKYVQYHYMGTDVTTAATFTNTANWQSENADIVPTAKSKNLVESGGVAENIAELYSVFSVTEITQSKITSIAEGSITDNTVTLNAGASGKKYGINLSTLDTGHKYMMVAISKKASNQWYSYVYYPFSSTTIKWLNNGASAVAENGVIFQALLDESDFGKPFNDLRIVFNWGAGTGSEVFEIYLYDVTNLTQNDINNTDWTSPDLLVGNKTTEIHNGLISEAQKEINTINNTMGVQLTVDENKNGYLKDDGDFLAYGSGQYITSFYKIDEESKYNLHSTNNNTILPYYAFFASKTDTECINGKFTYASGDNTIETPTGANYIAVVTKFNTGSSDNISIISLSSINGEFMTLKKQVRNVINIYVTDSNTVIADKMYQAYNLGNTDVIWENGKYTIKDALEYIHSHYASGTSYTGLPIGNNCRYFFNGAIIEGEVADNPTSGLFRMLFDSQRTGGSYEMHDATFKVTNFIYVVHDESAGSNIASRRVYDNIKMIYDYTASTPPDANGSCIGAGSGTNTSIIISNCSFYTKNTAHGAVTYHGIGSLSNKECQLRMCVNNCYFENFICLTTLGTTETGYANLNNNSFGYAPDIAEKWTILSYNNEIRNS